MATITDYRQQWRRDTAANLASDNPTPENGEPVMESDTQRWKMGDGSTAWNSLTYQSDPGFSGETFDVIDTDAGDVAATTPTTPVNGELWTVVNSGSSGNHVTGLPGSISLGDGKTITFKYDSTNTTWRYEDVIIDEYDGAGSLGETQYITKWSGGKMRLITEPIDDSAGTSYTFLESFNTAPIPVAIAQRTPTNYGYFTAISTTGMTLSDGTGINNTYGATVEGRWKA